MYFYVSAISDVGKVRKNNEDNFYVNGFYRSDYTQNFFSYENTFIAQPLSALAVFDGMGGTQYGEEASGEAAKTLDKYLKATVEQNVELNVEMLIRRINNGVCRAARNLSSNSGSTIVLSLIKDEKVQVINVGDSRAYLFRDGGLKQLSVDHNEAALYKELNIDQTTDNSKNVLTQSLGIEEKEFVLEPAVSEIIDLQEKDIILLCSDGLCGFVSDADITEVLKSADSEKEKAEKLIEKALETGGRDNITVVLAKVE